MRLRRYHGRHLRRRPRGKAPAAVGTAAAVWFTTSTAHAGEHVVAPGETLSSIARRYGTTVEALAKVNRLANPDLIVAGQRLRVPLSVMARSVHVVRAGETLSSIAARYGASVDALARLNRLRDPNLIVAGTRLQVPGGPSTTTTVSSGAAPVTDVGGAIAEQAIAHGVDPALAQAVGWQESGWQQGVVSDAGAIGIMQVMPKTARFVNRVLGGHGLDVRSAAGNIHLGVMYLRHMLDTMPSERKALAAYYAGPAAVGRRLTTEQANYAAHVGSLKARFR